MQGLLLHPGEHGPSRWPTSNQNSCDIVCHPTVSIDPQIGLADALETLCGQAYGAKQYHMLGIYLQRAFLILAVAAMPISLVWLAMSQILLAVGEDAELARAAQTYMMWLLPSLFGYVLLPPLIKFFQMQRAMYELLICSGVTVAVQIPLCWLFIDQLHFGFVGAAIAGNISLAVQLGCLWAFICFSPKFEKTFPTMSREVFEDLGEFLWLAIPSATMAWCVLHVPPNPTFLCMHD